MAFEAGAQGAWRIERMETLVGAPLAPATFLDMTTGLASDAATWRLRGATGAQRYTTRAEMQALGARQEGLGRPAATCAALIPIRKTEQWWALAQDERRAIVEEDSRHIAIGLGFLPAIARRLHHCRELGEPFDFLTWFEFAREDAPAFDDLLARLRATAEWAYVDREIDIRLTRVDPPALP